MVKERDKKVDIAKKFGVSRNTLHRYIKDSPAPLELISSTNALKTIKILLQLVVENNSKWVQGKKKTYEDIEMFALPYYDFEKTKNEHEYILTIEYEDDTNLDEQIDDLYSEIGSTADNRNCFIDNTSISTLDNEKHGH